MDELLTRIDNLLHPLNEKRLNWLMDCDEFMAARFRLERMREKIEHGEELTPRQLDFLLAVDDKIKYVNPHFEIITVNGEKCPVLFLFDKQEAEVD